MKDQLYVDKDQLMELIGVGPKKAYQIIRDVNKELAAAGFIIIKGRCPRKHLFKRLGIVEDTEEEGAESYGLQGIC